MRRISLLIASLFLAVSLGGALAQEVEVTVELPRPGITPDSFFYFLDRFGEKVELFFAFGAEAKVKVRAKHALERVAEVKVIIEEKGVEAPGIDVALANLEENAQKTEEIIQKKKAKGEEVSELARLIVDEFHKQRKAVKQVFNEARDEFLKQKGELHAQLLEAVQAGDETLAEEIRTKLTEIEAQKDTAEVKKDTAVAQLEAEKKKAQEELLAEEKELEILKDEEEKVKEDLEETKEKEEEIERAKELLEVEKEKAKEEKQKELEKEKEERLKALEEEREKIQKEREELEKELEVEKPEKPEIEKPEIEKPEIEKPETPKP